MSLLSLEEPRPSEAAPPRTLGFVAGLAIGVAMTPAVAAYTLVGASWLDAPGALCAMAVAAGLGVLAVRPRVSLTGLVTAAIVPCLLAAAFVDYDLPMALRPPRWLLPWLAAALTALPIGLAIWARLRR